MPRPRQRPLDFRLSVHNAATLAEGLYLSLKTAIVKGQIDSSRVLTETNLVKASGISRTPVREALTRLVAEGYLRAVPRKGYHVMNLSTGVLKQLYEVRQLLEGYAAELAAQRISEDELVQMTDLLSASERVLGKSQGTQTKALLQINDQFHGVLYAASRNEPLINTIRHLSTQYGIYGNLTLNQEGERRRSVHEHAEILKAVRNHDSALAGTLVRRHISRALDYMLAQVDQDLSTTPAKPAQTSSDSDLQYP